MNYYLSERRGKKRPLDCFVGSEERNAITFLLFVSFLVCPESTECLNGKSKVDRYFHFLGIFVLVLEK